MSGDKDDTGKPRIHLIPTEAILGMAAALEMGAKKYGDYNFRKGISYTRIINSLLRHTLAYLGGEDKDSESGLSHVDHIGANFSMLKYMEENCKKMDDRYKKEEPTIFYSVLTKEEK